MPIRGKVNIPICHVRELEAHSEQRYISLIMVYLRFVSLMKRNLVIVVAGVIVAISAVVSALNTVEDIMPASDLAMSYEAYDVMRDDLGLAGITMSSQITLQNDRAVEYCSFFGGYVPEYCTSTEMKDATGAFVGNVHMMGTPQKPQVALGVIQSDGIMSQRSYMVAVASTMIDTLVCKCWPDLLPGGFENVRQWVDTTMSLHIEEGTSSTISRIDGLPVPVLMEVITNDAGYEWRVQVGTVS